MQHRYISLLCLLALTLGAYAQQDTAQIDRTVYVTRDFQPTVESAGKIAVKPTIFEPQIELQSPQYSNYSSPLSLDYTMNKLDFSTLNFRQPDPLNGYLQAGIGHANSLFLFNYRITDAAMQRKMTNKTKSASNDLIFDVHASHIGQWGYKALSQSALGLDLSKQFTKAELYVGLHGGHEFFSRYGHYFNTADDTYAPAKLRLKDIDDPFRQNVWLVNTNIGVKNVPGADFLYQLQGGYEAFVMQGAATEHQAHFLGMFEWKQNYNHIGANVDIRNFFYTKTDTSLYTLNHHRIHIEPYYAYDGSEVRLHAGVNLDFSANKGKPTGISPNVTVEADLARNWLAFYGTLLGNYEAYGARGEYYENRYRTLPRLFADTLSGEYTPIDLEIGLKFRPYNTLLINVHAGYELTIDKHVNVFLLNSGLNTGLFEHELETVSAWKIGGDIHFHYKDIVNVNVSGNYYAHKAVFTDGVDVFGLGTEVFDTPSWRVDARIDGKINQKWSLYSDNHLAGGTRALTYDPSLGGRVEDARHPVGSGEGNTTPAPVELGYRAVNLRPMIDLNLGVKYEVNKWLSVYAQLNNYLAWTPKLSYSTFYGYEAMGANCMMGVSYCFK